LLLFMALDNYDWLQVGWKGESISLTFLPDFFPGDAINSML
jgi:hypothetical protein